MMNLREFITNSKILETENLALILQLINELNELVTSHQISNGSVSDDVIDIPKKIIEKSFIHIQGIVEKTDIGVERRIILTDAIAKILEDLFYVSELSDDEYSSVENEILFDLKNIKMPYYLPQIQSSGDMI